MSANPPIARGMREELQLFPQERDHTGREVAMIYDPLRHTYYRIAGRALNILEQYVSKTGSSGKANVSEGDLERVSKFLQQHHLSAQGQTSDGLYSQAVAQRPPIWKLILHNYLFFRIPLLRPAPFLERIAPLFGFAFHPVFWLIICATALLGAYLAMREWSEFVSGLQNQLQLSGLLIFAIALLGLKTLHEFAHAITATRYGCRVATMGVAFLLLAPVLYTDTTDVWRLSERRQRLYVTSAGVLAELCVAAIALLLWSFLPDGVARSLALSIAVAAPLMSLAINLNPAMRFDGYFLLMDLWCVENLQKRAFALARWRMREILFALGEHAPEILPRALTLRLIAYAWFTWIYRAFLFLAIALFVYAFFVKVIGIALFVVEILWFLVLPVGRELAEWWARRRSILQSSRSLASASVLIVLLGVMFAPWSTSVALPAVLSVQDSIPIHARASARLTYVSPALNSGEVPAGETILKLESPELDSSIEKSGFEIRLLQERLARLAGDPRDREQYGVLKDELTARQEKLAGFKRMRSELIVRAPAAGRLVDVDPNLHAGRWISPAVRIASLVLDNRPSIRALAGEYEVTRISAGDRARFIADDLFHPAVHATVVDIDSSNESALSLEALALDHGGAIAATRLPSGKFQPAAPVFAVRFDAEQAGQAPIIQSVRGVVVVTGRAESFASRVWRRIARVLIRESGF